MPFLVFIFLVLIAIVGYWEQLNPNRVPFFVTPHLSYDVSLTTLILFSAAAGGLLTIVASGIRQTKALYLNWTYRRQQKKEDRVNQFYKEGVNAALAKRYKDATLQFQKALAINPNHINTLLQLGRIYRMEKNFNEAIRLHRKARVADDQNMEVLLGLAQDLESAQQFDEAITLFREIIRRDEDHLTALTHLKDLYIRNRSWEDAHAVMEKTLKLSLPDETRQKKQNTFLGIKFEMGMRFLEHNQIDSARRAFKSAIKLDKNFLAAYMGLGETYVKSQRVQSAMTVLEKGYDLTKNLILLHRLEELCLEEGQPERILSAYQKALAKDPHHIALKFYLGKLYYRLEMIDESFDLLSEVEGQVQHFPDLHKVLGNLYLRRGEPLRAAESFRKGLQIKGAVIVPYYCPLCDYHTHQWSGRCARCGQWNSYQALPIMVEKEKRPAPPLHSLVVPPVEAL